VLHHDEFGWHLWASVHPLESWDDADRMTTEYATSPDGVHWTWRATALAGRPGEWDARGVRSPRSRSTATRSLAAYDGRATAGENWEERTGVARGTRLRGRQLRRAHRRGREPVGSPHAPNGLRYLSLVTLPAAGSGSTTRRPAADGAHDLRTEPA
jgi:hypothetical protein